MADSGPPIEIRSADDLAKLQRELKSYGDGQMVKRMRQVITRATKPIKAKIKSNADRLPSSGGLSARIRASTVGTRNKVSGRNIGVTISAKSREGYDLAKLDAGQVRHKAWGREEWYEQDVEPGFFSDAVKDGSDDVRKEILEEASKIAREIERAH